MKSKHLYTSTSLLLFGDNQCQTNTIYQITIIQTHTHRTPLYIKNLKINIQIKILIKILIKIIIQTQIL